MVGSVLNFAAKIGIFIRVMKNNQKFCWNSFLSYKNV